MEAAQPEEPPASPRQSWLQRLTGGLRRSSDQLTGNITAVFTKRRLDAATLDELEDVLVQADLGVDTATAITEALRRERFGREVSAEDVRGVLGGGGAQGAGDGRRAAGHRQRQQGRS